MHSIIKTGFLFVAVSLLSISCSKDNPVIYGSTNLYKVGVYVAAKDSTTNDEIYDSFRHRLLSCYASKIDNISFVTNKQLLDWSITNRTDYIVALTTYTISDTATVVVWLRERQGIEWKAKYCAAIPVAEGDFIASLDTVAKLTNAFIACSLATDTTDTARAIEIHPELIRTAPLNYYGSDTGHVYLKGKVTYNGLVDDVVISRSSGSIDLDSAAVNCLYGYLFTPAIAVDKRPVEVWVMIPVRYP
jgi:hypothetical protein